MGSPDLDAAARFLAASGRVLDRRRFERHFAGGAARPVRDAVAAYRNDDGGFGHALEPDGRAPGSQPAALQLALRTLHEVDAWDEDLVAGGCDWLERSAPAEGGAMFVDPGIAGWPHAPWWRPQDGLPASLVTTGAIVGTLNARGFRHPWVERANELMWSRVEALGEPLPYEMLGIVAFLQTAPGRARARAAIDALADSLHRVVTLDPDAPGEVHGPLEFAPLPDSLARAVFDAGTIEAHLDHLAGAQRDDGGWTFNWPAWSPAAEADWRGSITVDALLTLRANGRLPASGPG